MTIEVVRTQQGQDGHECTFIELLAVFAINPILAAMLLPALSAAKAKAQGIKCLSNVKQLQLAWYLHTDDNESQRVPANQWCCRQAQ